MECPHCAGDDVINRGGAYVRKSDNQRVSNFRCVNCGESFTDAPPPAMKTAGRPRALHFSEKQNG